MFYAKHLMTSHANAKVGVLLQDDDFGKEMLAGLKEGLGAKAATMIVAAESFQATDPTVDSQIVTLKGAGADAVMLFTYAKQAAQAIRKISDMGWKPDTYLHLGSASIGATLTPAGLDRSVGVKTAGFMKDATDPQWANDPFIKGWVEWMKKYMPDANLSDSLNLAGYAYAQTLEQVLKQCGSDLTRENIMKQAASLDMTLPMLLPGVNVKTGPDDFYPIEREQLARFDGKTWVLFGKVYGR
jgi:branched-chain amino acid transport system substrate-binding protein